LQAADQLDTITRLETTVREQQKDISDALQMVVEQRLPAVVSEQTSSRLLSPSKRHTYEPPIPHIEPTRSVPQRYSPPAAAPAPIPNPAPSNLATEPTTNLRAELNILDSEIAVLQQSLLAAASRLVKQ